MTVPKGPLQEEFVEVARRAADAAEHSRERMGEWAPAHGADREGMPPIQELAAREQSLLRRAIPALKNRWPELVACDERLAELDARATELAAAIEEHREQLRHVDDEDADRFRRWEESDREGDRPEVRRPALEQALHSLEVEGAGLAAAVASAEEARVRVITSHRRVLVRDSTELVEQRKREAEQALAAAEEARDALVEAAAHRLWARTYPDPSSGTRPPYEVVGAALPNTLATTAKQALSYSQVLDALREDLVSIVDVMSAEHRRLLVDSGEIEAEAFDPAAAHWAGEEPPTERQRIRAEVERMYVQEFGALPRNEAIFDTWVEQLRREGRLPL